AASPRSLLPLRQCLPEQEWGSLESQQKELYRIAMKGSYEAVVSLGEAQSLPMCQTLYYPLGWVPGSHFISG
uniref:KRAB domain-containing protein n=1 Tax=Otus sunia TaxID=257818 RepID=A0A8C8AUH6_9STRI